MALMGANPKPSSHRILLRVLDHLVGDDLRDVGLQTVCHVENQIICDYSGLSCISFVSQDKLR